MHMGIGNIASVVKYRMNKQFQNLSIFGTLIVFQIEEILKKFCFYKLRNSTNQLIFQFGTFHEFFI